MTQRAKAASGLQHPLLSECVAVHGFGTRASVEPQNTCRPQQVHGRVVARVARDGRSEPREADAIVSAEAGRAIAIVTADCVPVLACARDGSAAAAIHAGWRGLADGVVEAGMAALRDACTPGTAMRAVVGPRIGACCYEVDAPVLDALERRFGARLEDALRPARPGHWFLELATLVQQELLESGVAASDCASLPDACTRCDAQRFHSYRRDGAASGRLVHYIAARGDGAGPPGARVDRP